MSISVLVAALLGLTACSDKAPGTAVPSPDATDRPTTTAPSGKTTAPTASRRPSEGTSPISVDPCSLMTATAASELGLDVDAGENRKLGNAETCRWKQRGAQDTYLFTISIYDEFGIKDLPDDIRTQQLPPIGEREAVQFFGQSAGICGVMLAVTEASRVETSVTAGVDTDKACELAGRMAGLVEPELP